MSAFVPETEQEAANIIREHSQAARPLSIAGGNTRAGFGNAVVADTSLRSIGLSGIVAYNPGEMVITVRAGTPVAEVETTLAANGQMMAFDPMDHRGIMGTVGEPTIGGVFAANVSGPRRLVAGAARDSLLGIRFVNGRGEIVKNGGRVMKNVTGLDLVKLLSGSHGTLGFLTELTFRAPPRPKAEQTVVLWGLSDGEATSAMAAAMALPLEVSGAAHLPATVVPKTLRNRLPSRDATVFRLEGLPSSVDARASKLAMAMSPFGPVSCIDDYASRALWNEIRDVRPFTDGTTRPVWRVSVAPSAGYRIVAAMRLEARVDAYYDWQGGLIWIRMEDDPKAELLRRLIEAHGGGHATLIRASDAARLDVAAFQPESDAVAIVSGRLRQKLDPAGIFNPGKMARR